MDVDDAFRLTHLRNTDRPGPHQGLFGWPVTVTHKNCWGQRVPVQRLRTRIVEGTRAYSEDGAASLARRLIRRAYIRSNASVVDFPLLPEDIASSSNLSLPTPLQGRRDQSSLSVGWIMVPPVGRSGGHTTIFRMVEALTDAGHKPALFLYDRYHGSLRRHEREIRFNWSNITCEVNDAREGLPPMDVYIATSWQTAHVLARRSDFPTRRLYFVQDFEPWFYPRGTESALAEDTYRFGFHPVTVGSVLARILSDEYGVSATVAPFGCDTDVYRLIPSRSERDGVVFYAKPDAPRRGFMLGTLALEEFHRRHPSVPIHLVGHNASVPFPAIKHGPLAPRQLAELYNACFAGLALSFTNLSLVPDELLACGVVPVLNDDRYARAELTNPFVRWSQPTPTALADQLSEVALVSDRRGQALRASKSVVGGSWTAAQRALVHAVESEGWRAT